MAPRNSTFNSLIPAVAYYRKSTKGKSKDGRERQEASIPEQRNSVKQFAVDNGYQIIREYVDHESGDKTEKRDAFQRMHHDACNGRDFDAILCWDQDRFGRFDSMEAGYYIHPLRKAGVTLVTVNDGPVDWHDFTGRVMYQLKQEGKHQFLRDLSANVSRGLLAKAMRGKWVQGNPPIGFSVDANDRLILGPAKEVRLVRKIFRLYLKCGSLSDVADKLNLEGIYTRSGGKWYRSALREILRRRLYTGVFVWNQGSTSNYSSIREGKVSPSANNGRRTQHDESDQIVIENNHPTIIDQETFDAVQDRLDANNGGRNGVRSGRPDQFVLTGLLRCDKCGGRMYGRKQRGIEYFICGGYLSFGRSHCDRNSVRQDKILRSVITSIGRQYGDAKTLQRLRAELERQTSQPPQFDDDRSVAEIRKQITTLDGKVATAKRRLALCDDDVYADVRDVFRALKRERSTLSDQLASVGKSGQRQIKDAGEQVEAAMQIFAEDEGAANG